MNTYSGKYNKLELERYKKIFQEENCTFCAPQYMYFQAKKNGLTASFYESGKFVIQGAKADEILEKYFEIEAPKTDKTVPYPHIGVDESGKGDFFGPLVIAGAYLTEENAKKCIELGIKDSKKITDKKILELESAIKEFAIYETVIIMPKKYNELYSKFKNLNKLLAWGHSTVIENILNKQNCDYALCDQFADEKVIINAMKDKGRKINLVQRTKAEEDMAVACASILARAEFIKRVSNLSREYGLNLPKGVNNEVRETAKKISQKFGKEELINIAKTHFKTYEEI